jgi:hypothetical protein
MNLASRYRSWIGTYDSGLFRRVNADQLPIVFQACFYARVGKSANVNRIVAARPRLPQDALLFLGRHRHLLPSPEMATMVRSILRDASSLGDDTGGLSSRVQCAHLLNVGNECMAAYRLAVRFAATELWLCYGRDGHRILCQGLCELARARRGLGARTAAYRVLHCTLRLQTRERFLSDIADFTLTELARCSIPDRTAAAQYLARALKIQEKTGSVISEARSRLMLSRCLGAPRAAPHWRALLGLRCRVEALAGDATLGAILDSWQAWTTDYRPTGDFFWGL